MFNNILEENFSNEYLSQFELFLEDTYNLCESRFKNFEKIKLKSIFFKDQYRFIKKIKFENLDISKIEEKEFIELNEKLEEIFSILEILINLNFKDLNSKENKFIANLTENFSNLNDILYIEIPILYNFFNNLLENFKNLKNLTQNDKEKILINLENISENFIPIFLFIEELKIYSEIWKNTIIEKSHFEIENILYDEKYLQVRDSIKENYILDKIIETEIKIQILKNEGLVHNLCGLLDKMQIHNVQSLEKHKLMHARCEGKKGPRLIYFYEGNTKSLIFLKLALNHIEFDKIKNFSLSQNIINFLNL